MLAELLAAALLPHVVAQQLRVTAHHVAHLAQGRKRRHLLAGEGGSQVAEQPRPPQAPAAHDHARGTGLLHHPQRVGGLPDVAVAQHRDVHGRGQLADGVPVGTTGVRLRHGAAVQRDRSAAALLGDPAGVEVGQVVLVDALAGLHRDRHVIGRRRPDGVLEDVGQQAALPRQRASATLARDLGDGAAEVQVDVGDAVLRAEDLGGLADVDRVGAVELDRARGLQLVEDQHVLGVLVALHQTAAGDHLADVEAGALLGAEPAVRRVRDAGHRREDHRGRHVEGAEGETGCRRGSGGHASMVPPVRLCG